MSYKNKLVRFLILPLFFMLLLFTGCDGGSGSTTSTIPTTTENPIHTEFYQSKAYISQLGQSFVCSVTVSETRGDEIQFSKMYTYRTFADSVNSGRTANYYSGAPSVVYGWMFDYPATTSPNFRDAYIRNESNITGWAPQYLKSYERRTLTVNVMIGLPSQTKPVTFNGFFIPYTDYSSWVAQGYTGVRYWVTYEGYDYKLNDTYNVHIPLEVLFPANLNTDPYTAPGDDTTNPYDPLG